MSAHPSYLILFNLQLVKYVVLTALNVIQWVVVHNVPVNSIMMGVAVVSVW